MPAGDLWADNLTAITGNTSEYSVSIDVDPNNLSAHSLSVKNSFQTQHNLNNESACNSLWKSANWSTKCSIWCGPFILGILSFFAFISPLVMMILPKIETLEWKVKDCGPECDGTLISCIFKLTLLSILFYFTFFSVPRASFPRIDVYRALLITLLTFLLISYWVFYIEKIWSRRFLDYELNYQSIVIFSVSIVDLLLWIHFAAVIILKLNDRESFFIIKVTRSPDGEARSYRLGQVSIQRAAVIVLENYYTDFTIYNPYLELARLRGFNNSVPRSTLKFYDIDGTSSNGNGFISNNVVSNGSVVSAPIGLSNSTTRNLLENTSHHQHQYQQQQQHIQFHQLNQHRQNHQNHQNTLQHQQHKQHQRHHHHHSHRFYEDHEYERRVRKRKARLLSATEDAFTNIRRITTHEPCPVSNPIDPKEASQAIFPAMARSLQKFLRVTRQQPRHTVESIVDHLATCLTYDLSPKAFLESFFNPRPVISCATERKPIQTWGLVSDVLLTRTIESGTVFMLRQNDVSLLVTVTAIPHLNIKEEIIDPKCNKFVFKMNSETSV